MTRLLKLFTILVILATSNIYGNINIKQHQITLPKSLEFLRLNYFHPQVDGKEKQRLGSLTTLPRIFMHVVHQFNRLSWVVSQKKCCFVYPGHGFVRRLVLSVLGFFQFLAQNSFLGVEYGTRVSEEFKKKNGAPLT